MKDIKLRTLIIISIFTLTILFSLRPYLEKSLDRLDFFDTGDYLVDFIDDSNVRIKMNSYAKRIISLYPAHTENLFSLNLDKEIIGVSKSDNYPLAVLDKEAYDYEGEPEKILTAKPDLVLITPFIERENPNFVKTLRRTGINVVSLYPTEFKDFSSYIKKLGMLTGKKNTAKILIENYNHQIQEIKEATKNIDNKVNVFLETSEIEYKTILPNSFAAEAIKIAGGINIAKDAAQIDKRLPIADFGKKAIMENSGNIDIYLSQRGGTFSGGNIHSIVIRPDFDKIKAVQNQRVYTINERLVFHPTIRYIKGIKELCRIFYPDIFDNITPFDSNDNITREALAEVLVRYAHKQIFLPSSRYYKDEHEGHVYGFFGDVPLEHKSFDFIETAVISGYIDSFNIDGVEMFFPKKHVTRDEFAKAVYLLGDVSKKKVHISIKDLNEIENKRIVQTLVDNKIFKLKDGYFYPKEFVSGTEVIEVLNRLK
ncbi:ABC transporter substrate-binding protein [Paramaledivibacter caminithermalis]|uniref:Iron complex transport system substrate-binding protein n=1 Tax=Paramaledivibacter caminithermalis (strain DSM 15212 / CIP 107654 / DViRD3) TaxID=1121301 RepID=A0A1M6ML67_PARC5|nr:ABC transporter substrate-binding protein [Paramaledivibacter caminithermalis]SHJ84023.1 iron complex transport system substrate-binding protein [Paramaledivibacter caminithermalis DSM 15212]